MAHAVGLRADQQCDPVVVLEANFRTFVRCAACGLHEAGDANAAQPAALLCAISARGESGMVGERIRIVDIRGETAAVDHRAKRLPVRKLRYQITPAQIDRIETAASRGFVDQTLHHIVYFRLAGAAIGIDRHGVGEHALHVHEDRGNNIAAAHRVGRRIGGTAWAARRQIRAKIGNRGNIQCQKASFRIQCQPRARDIVAALCGGDEIFRPFAHPFDRPAQCARRPQQHHPFGIQRVLYTESAADIGASDVHLFRWHAEYAAGEHDLAMHARRHRRTAGGIHRHHNGRWPRAAPGRKSRCGC